MTYNSLQGIFTTMIGFVTWPPFCTIIFYKVHSENTGKIRYLLDLVYFLSNVLSTKLYGNEPVVARYTMEDANCTLTEPLRLMESLSRSSCDKE